MPILASASFPTMSTVPSRAHAYHHASDLPPAFWSALMQDEPAANIILPFATKAKGFPRGNGNDQLWIISYDVDKSDSVEFVLSCTSGPMGNYPIFVFTPKSSAQLFQGEDQPIAESLLQLVLCLLREVPPQRVFSVFSVLKVAEKFAEIFQEQTHQEHGIVIQQPYYYDATFAFCTRETLREPSYSLHLREDDGISIALRLADISHLDGVRDMCMGFSHTSEPYKHDSDERAELEARTLIDNRQAWVHMIKKGDGDWETACLIATTRESENVTAVTKVYTANHWRGHGCAGRLLHRVCQEILQRKECVVLYVGEAPELMAARRVYQKVGFQGLNAQQEQDAGRWVEIGFKPTNLGYW